MLAMRKAGRVVLITGGESVEDYRRRFNDYFMASRIAVESPTGTLAGIAFDPFLIGGKKSLLEIINHNYDLLKGVGDCYAKLAEAIRRALPKLEPRGHVLSVEVREKLVKDIVCRIEPSLVEQSCHGGKGNCVTGDS